MKQKQRRPNTMVDGVPEPPDVDTMEIAKRLARFWPKRDRRDLAPFRSLGSGAKIVAKKIAHLFEDRSPPSKVRTLADMSENEIRKLEIEYGCKVKK